MPGEHRYRLGDHYEGETGGERSRYRGCHRRNGGRSPAYQVQASQRTLAPAIPMRITGILLTACLLLRRSPRTYRSSPVTRALPTINVCAFYGIRRTCFLPRRIPKTVALYQLDILGALTQTGIQQTAAGGKARAFCDIVGDQLGTMETNEFLNLGETLI